MTSLELLFTMPEHSCPYINDILDWLEPESPYRNSEVDSLTHKDIANMLEEIRSINYELRSRCVSLIKENEKFKYKIDTMELTNSINGMIL